MIFVFFPGNDDGNVCTLRSYMRCSISLGFFAVLFVGLTSMQLFIWFPVLMSYGNICFTVVSVQNISDRFIFSLALSHFATLIAYDQVQSMQRPRRSTSTAIPRLVTTQRVMEASLAFNRCMHLRNS